MVNNLIPLISTLETAKGIVNHQFLPESTNCCHVHLEKGDELEICGLSHKVL